MRQNYNNSETTSNIIQLETLGKEYNNALVNYQQSYQTLISLIQDSASLEQEAVSITNGNFDQPQMSNNTYEYITPSESIQVPGWIFNNGCLINNSTAWGYPIPYPSGNQCVSIQETSSIGQIINLQGGVSYTLTFYACGRSGISNPIDIDLYDMNNVLVTNIYSIQPPVSQWTLYTTSFTAPSSQQYQLYFTGTWSSSDRSTAIQNIQLNSSNGENTTAVNNAINNVQMWNTTLINLNQQIIDIVQDENPLYENEIEERKNKNSKLKHNLLVLREERDKVNEMITYYDSKNAINVDSSIVTRQEYTKYILYSVITIIVIIIFIKVLFLTSNNNGQSGGGINGMKMSKFNDILFLFAIMFLFLSFGFFFKEKSSYAIIFTIVFLFVLIKMKIIPNFVRF